MFQGFSYTLGIFGATAVSNAPYYIDIVRAVPGAPLIMCNGIYY